MPEGAALVGDRVFMDVSDIAPSADFESVLRGELASGGAVLAIIGVRWSETWMNDWLRNGASWTAVQFNCPFARCADDAVFHAAARGTEGGEKGAGDGGVCSDKVREESYALCERR